MSQKALYAAIGAIVLVAVAYGAYAKLSGGSPSESQNNSMHGDAGAADDSIQNEEERVAYVASSIEISDLSVSQEQKPDDAGPVHGLLRVSGTVHNKGDRAVRSVRLVVNPQSTTGKVLGTYIDDVLRDHRLGPGESKAFKFQIPEKPEFSGKFLHEVR